MKIIVNNANMTFVKGVANMLASVNWVSGYWNKNAGSTQKVFENDTYFRNEELIPVDSRYRRFQISWEPRSEASTIFIAFNDAENKVISSETPHTGDVIDIPEGTTTLCVFGLNTSFANGVGTTATLKGVFE